MNILQEFLLTSTSRQRGILTKAIQKNTNWRPDLQSEFRKRMDNTLSFNEQYYLIANGLKEPCKCEVCGKDSILIDFETGYRKYCSQKCYLSTLSENNPDATQVTIDGIEYSSMKAAMSGSGLSYHMINRKINLGEAASDKTSKRVESKLRKQHEKLLDKEWLKEQRKLRLSTEQIAEMLNVKRAYVFIALDYHNISSKYDQLSEKARTFIESEQLLRDFISSGNTILWAMKEYEIGYGGTITKAFDKFGLEYDSPIKQLEQHNIAELIRSWGFEVEENNRKLLNRKEIDIYLPSLNIGIEYNGIYWHSEQYAIPSGHQNKFLLCKEKGIRLLQIFEDDWLNEQKRPIIINKLRHILGLSSERIYARNTEVCISSNKEVRSFFTQNHLQGHKNAKEIYTLKCNNEIVAAISFNGDKLERFATSKNVIGGFSKLLKASGKSKVTTYADLCWSDSDNNVYTKNGFELVKITQPGYFWVVGGIRKKRENYQKWKLKNMSGYDDNLTEKEIMEKNGYYRIFDAGHAALEYKISE
jgi:endogenous inhibitor of DNA gyrase (YacG/DUF329 family)